MMPAVKHLDPVLGVDIHLIITPPGAVVPIPHPHIGMVFDPFDYLPIIGSTVNVNGLPRAQAGTGGIALPPHFPIGGAFLKPPGNDNETFMGSSTVLVDEEPFTHMLLPVLSCQDIGMPRPPRKKSKGGAKSLLLPTTVALSIPAGPPVIVGGPPTISLAGLAEQLALGALLKGLKKLRKLQKASRKMKALSDRLHRAANKVMDKLKVGPRARNAVHKALCTLTGHPVDVVTGRVVTEAVDWELPGPLPLRFERHYSSAWGGRDSAVGHGWSHSLDLAVWEEDGRVVYRAEDGREIEFDTSVLPKQRMPLGAEMYEPIDRLILRRTGELRWEVEAANGLVHELRQVAAGGPCRVVRTRSRAGHSIVYEYDVRGLLEWVVDSSGRRLRFEHNAGGQLVRTWLPHPTQPGLVPYDRYVYSEARELVEAYDALGHVRRYAYKNHLLVCETDRTGLSFYFEYDGQGSEAWCVRTWGDGGIYDHRLRYDKQRHVTSVTNSQGHTTTYYSEGHGVVVCKVDPLGGEWRYEYDDALRKQAEIDALGQVTRHEYDARGNLTKTVSPDGAVVVVEFDIRNLPIRVVDEIGGVWSYRYDSSGQLVEHVNSMGECRRYEYAAGLLRATVGRQSERVEFGYDGQKNLATIRHPPGTTIQFGYDKLGRATYLRDEQGAEWHVTFDALGQVIGFQEPTGVVWEKLHDGEGNLREIRSPLRVSRFGYTGFHRLAFVEEAGTRIIRRYDTEGRLVEAVNEAGETYRFELDERGLVVGEEHFDGCTWRYTYDAAGRLTHMLHPDQRKDTYVHDEVGRIQEVRYADGAFRRFEYRLDGLIVVAENEETKVRFERDLLGQTVEEWQGDVLVSSSYSRTGHRIGLRSSMGMVQELLRDAYGDVTAISYVSAARAMPWRLSLERDSGRLERARYFPGGVVASWRRDAAGRPLERRVEVCGEPQVLRAYRWRGENQVTAITDAARGVTEYLHDSRGRLVGARFPDGSLQRRVMDDVGNLFRVADRSDRSYGKGGRLEVADGTRYVYDARGCLVEKHEPSGGKWSYVWSSAGLLKELVRPDRRKVRFTYDALARRTQKTVLQADPEGREHIEYEVRFVWDGDVLLHEMSSVGGLTTWLFDSEGFIPIAREDSSGCYSIVTDHLGAPTEMYDESGRQVGQMQFDIFGAPQGGMADPRCPWRWPGQYVDEETTLFYNRYRYYDPVAGRYISRDPLGLAAGSGEYQYVGDPNVEIDPLGLDRIHTEGKIEVNAYPGPKAGGKEHSPLHAHVHEGDLKTRVLMEDYYKKGKLVASKGDVYPGDSAMTKNMKKVIKSKLEELAKKTKDIFEKGSCS